VLALQGLQPRDLRATGCTSLASTSSANGGASAARPSPWRLPLRQASAATPRAPSPGAAAARTRPPARRANASTPPTRHAATRRPTSRCSSFGGASAGSCSWSGWLTRGRARRRSRRSARSRSEFPSLPW
jgi:hypothetical protein